MAMIPIKRKIYGAGTSNVITLPEDMMEFIGAKRGDDVVLMVDEKKKGRFIAVFKEGGR